MVLIDVICRTYGSGVVGRLPTGVGHAVKVVVPRGRCDGSGGVDAIYDGLGHGAK